MSEASQDMYVIQYIVGGWRNWKVYKLYGEFTKEQADQQIADIKRMGYHAVKTKSKQFRTIGGIPDSSEFPDDVSKRRYYDEMTATKANKSQGRYKK